ncbi:hypothetical protein [Arthrobacter humicola]
MAQSASPANTWIGTIVFLLLAPGVVAGLLLPWFVSGWRWHDWGGAAWVIVPIAWIAIAIAIAVTFLLALLASELSVDLLCARGMVSANQQSRI